MELIQTVSLSLGINAEEGSFSIHPADARFPKLDGIRLGCEYSLGAKKYQVLNGGWRCESTQRGVLQTLEHGEMELLTFTLAQDGNKIGLTLTFGITREHPLVIWKVRVTNDGGQTVAMNRITLLDVDGRRGGKIHYPRAVNSAELGFFSNGWQSWSPSRWYSGDSKMNISRLGLLQHPMIYNPGTPLPRRMGVFSSDMFAVVGDRSARTGYLVGFLAQKNHFGSILADLNAGSISMWANGDDAHLEPGMSIETDWAVFTPVLLDHRTPLEDYLEAVARENHALVPADTPVGWCSWYHFYTNVTANNIDENLSVILDNQERLPVELVQIDDGFETQVGDWFNFKPTFPEGVKPLAEKISQAGLIPGLWLAPFIVHPGSNLIKEHPEWMLRQSNGRTVNAGFVWNALNAALDLTVPEALQYARDVVSAAFHDWGFPYLKLDFLYAAALKGEYCDKTKTRAQVMRLGMEALREAVGQQVTLLGCGAPLGSMIGLVEAMRIGPDVSGDWNPSFNNIRAFFRQEPSMPSARNSINNILTRANLNRLWWVNDPDCLLIRPDTRLTLDEVRSLATVIALTGGSLLLSDDLPALPPERMKIAEVLLPVMKEEVRVLDWFDAGVPNKLRVDMLRGTDSWYILGCFNWSDKPADMRIEPSAYKLEDGEYIYREFWSGKTDTFDNAHPLVVEDVVPHGSVLMAVRRMQADKAQYLGSDLHFSQGHEVAELREDEHSLEMTLRLPRTAEGKVFLKLPFAPVSVMMNGSLVDALMLNGEIYSIPVQVEGFCTLHIKK